MGIEVIAERDSKLSSEEELKIVTKQFGTKNTDSYVRKNSGVCFVFDQDPTYEVFNPKITIIESRDTYNHIRERGGRESEMAYHLLTNHVRFHELIHANQIGSNLMWKEMSNYAGTFFLDIAIKELKNDRLDYEQPERKLGAMLSEDKRTTRQILLDYVDLYAIQALSQHKLAKQMRKHGTHIARMNAKIPVTENESISLNMLKKRISIKSLENSRTKSNYLKIRKAMESLDIEHMRSVYKEVDTFSNGMLGVIETMAETFALEADRDYIKHLDKIPKGERVGLHQLLYGEVYGRGIRARQFIDASDSGTKKERDEKLAANGLKHQQIIGSEEDEQPVEIKLMELGYPSINPLVAYENMQELTKRAAKNNVPIEDLLYPTNAASALIGERYNLHLPEFTEHIRKHGRKQAFKNMLNAETFSDIIGK